MYFIIFVTLFGSLAIASAMDMDSQDNTKLKETWISISGTVVNPKPAEFTLNYGDGTIAVDMQDWKWYKKNNSNWGDGIKYCVNEKCLIYQAQDYSFRDVYGSQDYISSISGQQLNLSQNTVIYDNVFQNVSLEYISEDTLVKENFVISQLPRQPATWLNQSTITLDFGGYIKYPNLTLWSNGTQRTGNFVTTKQMKLFSSYLNQLLQIAMVVQLL